MPVITQKGDDGIVTAWFVTEGSLVQGDQLIAEVQAEKIADEVTAPGNGVVRNLVDLNEPIAQGEAALCRIEAVAERDAGAAVAEEPKTHATAAPAGARVRASPAAKRVARELGVDLTALARTDPDRRITEADVRAAAGESAPGAIELTGLRAVIARNMRASHTDTAPVTLTTTVDVTNTLREHVTAWIVWTVATALADHPDLHGHRDGDRFTPAPRAHIGVAVQTEDGLVAPVVRDAAARTVEEIAAEIADLATRARHRRLEASDLEGGTFTVTNLGPAGIEFFTPIINPPQVAILGVGAVRTVPGFSDDGRVVPREHLALSLTFDHAFIDGAPAAAFLAQVRCTLQSGSADHG